MTINNFEDLTSEYLREIAPKALVIIPVGSVEQHGPHLPVGSDSFNVQQLALKAVEKMKNKLVLVTPPLWFGSSHHHLQYSGTISLRGKTLLSVLCDIGNSLATGGFKKLFFLNGHGGNGYIIREAARELVNEHNNDLIIGGASYWEIANEALSKVDVPKMPGHAGTFETSLQLARDEKLVDHDAKITLENGSYSTSQYHTVSEQERAILRFQTLRGRAFFQRFDSFRKFGGVSDAPINASSKLGQEIIDIVVDELAQFFSDFLRHP